MNTFLASALNSWVARYEDPLTFLLHYIATPESVLHCGSHLGQESEIYSRAGVRNVWWVEAQ